MRKPSVEEFDSLLKRIRKEWIGGKPVEKISSDLVGEGWDPDDVSHMIAVFTETLCYRSPEAERKRKERSGYFWFFVFAFYTILIAAFYFIDGLENYRYVMVICVLVAIIIRVALWVKVREFLWGNWR